MIPLEKISNIINTYQSIEKELSSGDISKNDFVKKDEILLEISTDKVALLSQKLSLPTITTPSDSFGLKLRFRTREDHTTAEILVWPSVKVIHKWPFFN